MAVSSLKLGRAAALLALLLPVAAAAILPDSREPISLDAESSEFDREAGRLTFQGIRVVQGALAISADRAVANELDFADSTWQFIGDVRIGGVGSQIRADLATLRFTNHRLVRATATGAPATLSRAASDSLRALSGGASTIDYDALQGTIQLSGGAYLVDGANRVQGEQLLYRLAEERLVATSDEAGEQRVQITIKPPAQEPDEEESPGEEEPPAEDEPPEQQSPPAGESEEGANRP